MLVGLEKTLDKAGHVVQRHVRMDKAERLGGRDPGGGWLVGELEDTQASGQTWSMEGATRLLCNPVPGVYR